MAARRPNPLGWTHLRASLRCELSTYHLRTRLRARALTCTQMRPARPSPLLQRAVRERIRFTFRGACQVPFSRCSASLRSGRFCDSPARKAPPAHKPWVQGYRNPEELPRGGFSTQVTTLVRASPRRRRFLRAGISRRLSHVSSNLVPLCFPPTLAILLVWCSLV